MRAAPVLGRLALAAAGLALALTLAEVVVRVADLDFRPIRSRANEDAVLEQLEFRTRVVTNALGFRDRRLPGPKPPNTMRIVVLGDSFTQGYGVDKEQAYPRRLDRLLDTREPARRHEVVNLGVPGACPLDYVAHLREVGLGYDPDLVLVGLMANDVNDIRSQREFGGRILAQILRQVQDDVGGDRPAWKRLPQRLWPSLYEYVGNRLRARSPRNATAHAKTESAPAVPTAVSDGRWKEVLLELAARYGRRTDVEAALAHAPPEKLDVLGLRGPGLHARRALRRVHGAARAEARGSPDRRRHGARNRRRGKLSSGRLSPQRGRPSPRRRRDRVGRARRLRQDRRGVGTAARRLVKERHG